MGEIQVLSEHPGGWENKPGPGFANRNSNQHPQSQVFSFILSTPAFDGGRTEVPRTPVNRTDTPLSVRCFDGEIIANLGLRLLRVRLRSGHTRDEPGRDATAFPWQGRAKCWQARLYSYPFTQPENRPCRSSSGPGARRQARAWPRPAEP